MCVLCSALSCMPGYFSSGCLQGATKDAVCIPCQTRPSGGPFSWTRGCDFKCDPGFWQNGGVCSPCSTPVCDKGSVLRNCTAQEDARCEQCDVAITGPLNWTDNCGFACMDGFVLKGSECVSAIPVATPRDWDGDQTASLMGALCVCTTIVVATWGGVIKTTIIRIQPRPRMPRIDLRKRV